MFIEIRQWLVTIEIVHFDIHSRRLNTQRTYTVVKMATNLTIAIIEV